jgi:hypothetical protein
VVKERLASVRDVVQIRHEDEVAATDVTVPTVALAVKELVTLTGIVPLYINIWPNRPWLNILITVLVHFFVLSYAFR